MMAEGSRLDAHPDMAVALRRAAPGVQERAGRVAAEWAISRTGLSDPAVTAALNGGPLEPLAALAAELDVRYFSLSDACEEGKATADQVLAAFGLARAASAVEFVAHAPPAEAIYEAMAAADDCSELRRLIQALLHEV